MNERRQHPRAAVPTVTLRVAGADKLRRRYLDDISRGGLLVRTSKTLPVGSELKLRLEPPGEEPPIELKGRVVRLVEPKTDGDNDPGGMGIEFVDVSPEITAQLEELMAKYRTPDSQPAAEEDVVISATAGPDASEIERILRARLAEAEKQIKSLVSEIEHFEDDDSSSRNLIAQLLEEKVRVAENEGAASAETSKQAEELKSQIAKLKQQLNEAQGEAEAARKDLWELNADVAAVVADAKGQVAKLETELAASQHDLETMRVERDRLSATVTDAITAGRESVAGLQKELDAANGRVIELEDQVRQSAGLSTRIAELEAQAKEAAAASTRESETRATLAAAERQTQELLAELEQEQAATQAERERATELAGRIKLIEERFEKTRARERELRTMLSSLATAPAAPRESSKVVEEKPAPSAPANDEDSDLALDRLLGAEPAGEDVPDIDEPGAHPGDAPVSPAAAVEPPADVVIDEEEHPAPEVASAPENGGEDVSLDDEIPADAAIAVEQGEAPAAEAEQAPRLGPIDFEAELRRGVKISRVPQPPGATPEIGLTAEVAVLLEHVNTLAELEQVSRKSLVERGLLVPQLFELYGRGRIVLG